METNKSLFDIFEIFIITYNRKDFLKETLSSVYNTDSPVKDFQITILDNKSTDGSSEIIDDFIKEFPNSKHIIHNRNIGGNGNIARCYELASKKYFWILCDDDEIDWTGWPKVEYELLNNEPDAVVVSNYLNPKKNVAQLLGQLSFVPAGIYKTENLTDTVMQNIQWQISTMFPQLALACKLINDKKNIVVMDDHIVKMVDHPKVASYQRGLDSDKHPLQAIPWALGFLESIQLLRDMSDREFIIENLEFENGERILYPDTFLEANKVYGHLSFTNEMLYFSLLPARLKYMYSFQCFRDQHKDELGVSELYYNNSEIRYDCIKNSKAFKLGSVLLWLPKKIFKK